MKPIGSSSRLRVGGTRNTSIVLVLLAVLSCLVNSATASASSTETLPFVDRQNVNDDDLPPVAGRYDPLATWLWDLKIDIPDQHFKESIFSLSILHMECTHFALDSINSTYVPSVSGSINPAMDLSVAGITASCTGKYKSTGMTGKLSATVTPSEPQALGMRFDFESEHHKFSNNTSFPMATAITMEECDVHLKVSELHFTGSISAKIINLFRVEIRRSISDALAKQLCPVLKDTMDDIFTNLVQQADKYMLGLIPDDSEHSLEDAAMMSAAIPERQRMMRAQQNAATTTDNWKWNQDAPLAVTILNLVNKFLDHYLDQGVFLDAMKLIGFDVSAIEEDCGYFFHGINGLLRTLTGGHLEFGIPDSLPHLKNITFVIPNMASVSIMPKMVGIVGIDQLDHLTLLQPANKHDDGDSFWTKLQATKGLNITASLDIQIAAIPGGAFRGDPLLESFHVSINTTSLDISGNLTLDVNRTRFGKTTLNHMINGFNGNQADVGCCLYPIEMFGVEQLLATVGMQSISIVPDDVTNVSLKTFGGSLEHDIDGMINNFLSLFLTEYQTFVTLAFTGLMNGPAKEAAQKAGNDWLENMVEDVFQPDDATCEASGIINMTKAADYLNFSNVHILDTLKRFLNSSHTIGDANKYLECIADIVETEVKHKLPSLEYAGASLQLQSMAMENVGSIERIELLSPEDDGYHLSNSLHFGGCLSTNNGTEGGQSPEDCRRPRLIATAQMDAPSMKMSGSANITASIGAFQDSVSALLLFDLNQVRNLTVANLVSCHSCFLKPAAEAVLYAAPQVLNQMSLGISAQVTSDNMDPINVQLDSANYDGATSKMKSILSWTQMSIVDAINKIVAHMSDGAEEKCGRDNANQNSDNNDSKQKLTVTISIIVYLLPFYILSHILYIAYNQLKSQEETSTSSYEPLLEFERRDADDGMLAAFRGKNASLVTKEKISSVLRHTFPVVLIGTMALLVVSNLSVGASVDLSVSTGDTQGIFRLPSLFEFSLGNTIHDMYHAGIYVLLSIVVVFSGIWPYLKLMMMLWGWMAPESMFSIKKRGKLLFSLDALSKFSLVDTFVLVIMMVSFRLHLSFGDSAIIDVFVNPLFGFYGFLIATTVSLLAGHVELHVHRQSIANENESEDESKVSLFSHLFSFEGKKYRFSSILKVWLLAMMTTTIALLAVGSITESFTFEFGGLTGLLLDSDKKTTYSLFSIGTALPKSVEDSNGPGIMFLQVVYFFYSCIMPFACLLALSVLLVVPMTPSQQEVWLTTAEVANAWSAIEVFALSIVAALFEISTFASFIVGNKCDIINQILEDQFDDLLHGDDICYSVTASVGTNVWFLVVGVIMNSFIVSSLLRVAQVVIEERNHPDAQMNDSDDEDIDEPRGNVVHRWIKSAIGNFLLVEEDVMTLTEPLLGATQEIGEMGEVTPPDVYT